jgi:hypothetical protein
MATAQVTGPESGELAQLRSDFGDWRIWTGRDGHGQPSPGWHATLDGARTVVIATDSPAKLRRRLEQAEHAMAPAHV